MIIDNGLPLIEHFESITEWSWKVDKKYQKILKMIGTDDPNALSIVPIDWRIEQRYERVLGEFIKNKEMNIRQIHDNILDDNPSAKALSFREDNALYRKIQRDVNKLLSLNMIETSRESKLDNLGKTIHYYRLSLNGLFYVILNWMNFIYFDLLNNLFAEHSDSVLFKMFLFPYFEENTLIGASFSRKNSLIVEIINYLVEICKVILAGRRAKFGFSQGDDDYSHDTFSTTLFFWPQTYPENRRKFDHWYEKDSSLRSYLKTELGWKWISDAKIIPDYDNDIIFIKYSKLSDNPHIIINRHENNAVLINGADRIRFKLEKFKTGEYHVTAKTRRMFKSPKDRIEEGIRNSVRVKLLELFFKIKNDHYNSNSEIRQLLNKDKRFTNTIRNFVEVLQIKDHN